MSSSIKVAIVGGGPSGLTLAINLHAHNIRCEVYEMRPKNFDRGGQINLGPNSLRILDALGVYKDVLAAGNDGYTDIKHKDASFKTVQNQLTSDPDRYGYNSLRIMRNAIVESLAAAAHERGISIHYDHKFTSVVENDLGVSIGFENGASVKADILVGADGIWSKVRSTSFLDSPQPSFIGETFCQWSVPLESLSYPSDSEPLSAGERAWMVTPQGMALFVSTVDSPDVQVGVQRSLPELDHKELRMLQENKISILDMLQSNDTNVPNPVRSAIQRAADKNSNLFVWQFYKLSIANWMSRVGNGRVVILGDAAHAFPPFGGQGTGMAIEDADGLGKVLGQASMFANIDEALAAWQEIRRERVMQVSQYVAEVGRSRKLQILDGRASESDPSRDITKLGWLYSWNFKERLSAWMKRKGDEEDAADSTARGSVSH